ncbi:gamma-glutamyltransferase family protein [Lutimaribacter saemankumensis]|uniref:Gamma-glutamyltranspeptidase / glutathione hydrolase n=1 Tax=Lutimaribacter saemankumensis TaxID=490829 RepID=A0A1G8SBZ0_9RHOB|nr:gamma-glutamyltransferase family protein [Lutimaribacter saemankumensis]SDJ26739.1 gamma-glutamyltranspeptidase / glutathione hydrolase [Lutimaribacter saemankumensis]
MHDYQGPGRATAYAENGMCATSHPFAAMAAIDTLRKGGNAVDAAVAGAVVLGFCEPAMTGLGGDVFALIHDPEAHACSALNGSGRAPAALDAAYLRDQGFETIPLDSTHGVTVPGAVDAFEKLVTQSGKLSLAEVLAPAIHCAETGVPVYHRTALDWAAFGERLRGPARKHYLDGGAPFRAGTRFASPAQAQALRLIAQNGADAFYRGEIMEDIVATLKAHGGLHSAEDFAATAATPVDPVRHNYRGHDLVELPPNAQGVTALLITAILERFDISRFAPDSAERIHLEAEATRLAYRVRNLWLGDPETVGTNTEKLLSEVLADRLAEQIDPTKAGNSNPTPAEALHRDTVYITVVDGNHLAVSLIYSIFWPFGSGLASEKFGIGLHNRGCGFSLQDGHPNMLLGGRRPLHTLIPGLLEKQGDYVMPFGVMGGPYQAAGHAHFVSNIADYDMDPQTAIDGVRSFHDVATGKLEVEARVAESTATKLSEMGHDVVRAPVGIGGAQAIRIDQSTGMLAGGSDPRKDGLVLGY